MNRGCKLALFFCLLWGFPSSVPAQPSEMVKIPEGCFIMGSENGDNDEKPVHQVCLDSFYIDKYEVTQEDFEKVMGKNPAKFKGPKRPVEQVGSAGALQYCGIVGKRLPTEAEWERAARAGTTTEYYWGDQFDRTYVWVRENSAKGTHPVGQKEPNQYGLFDMLGNVWEWVLDYYDKDTYKNSPKKNPKGPAMGNSIVIRGGSWFSQPGSVRSANRYNLREGNRDGIDGFRCVK